MLKNIIGDWGSTLSDSDYACAIAALGVLESTGTEQHKPSSDTAALVAALETEFALGERTPVWRHAQNVGPQSTVDSWRETAHTDAVGLASAWRQYRKSIYQPRRAPRLAVPLDWRSHADLFDFDNLCDWLKHPEVGLSALVMADSFAPDGHISWHWPLQVGVGEGAEHGIVAAFRMEQRGHTWLERLARCYTMGAARDSYDLLVLSQSAAQLLLEESRPRIRATFIVCLEDRPIDLTHAYDRFGALRRRLHASGVVVVGRIDDSRQLEGWFGDLLREASHDVPIHAAVWTVGRWSFNRDSLVIGNPEALDKCRILAIAERQDNLVGALEESRGVHRPMPAPSPPSEPTFGGTGEIAPPPLQPKAPEPPPLSYVMGPPPSELPPPTLADEVRSRAFASEIEDGIRIAAELESRMDEIDQARSPRWIHAQAWRGDAPGEPARSFAPGQWNLLGTHIGPTLIRRVDASFPDRLVDFGGGEVSVTAQLELAGAAVTPLEASDLASLPRHRLNAIRPVDMRSEPELAEQLLRAFGARALEPPTSGDGSPVVGLASSLIVLPSSGDSTLAVFGVLTQRGVTQVDGRVAIIHNNRVLQTARLSVSVGDEKDAKAGLVVTAEAAIHMRDDDLEERREYDAAIQVSDVGGNIHLAIQRGDAATPVKLDDLKDPILAIRDALRGAAEKWDYSKPMLEQSAFRDCLYTLGACGSSLQQHLRKVCGDDIDRWERIHLVPSTNQFLPLEYVYDGPPPKTSATVCPNVPGALETGSCDLAVESPSGPQACPHQHDSSLLCPMHFWGFRRLIERNGAIREDAVTPAASGPVKQVCVPSRKSYCKVNALLFAASDRAFKYATSLQAEKTEHAELVKTLDTLLGGVSEVSNWEKWREQVKRQPNLLLLVAHTDKYLGLPALEIGDGKLLGRHEILPDLSCAAGQPQLLILLGCSAAGVTENFQPYPELFRDAGVSIVLAPVAPIRGADAVPIAKRIARLLAEHLGKPEPTSFGELLPILRRGLLLEGHPGVMGIVGFGDGDWLLGGQPC